MKTDNQLIVGVARNCDEIEDCLSIRHSVFVEEQKLFKVTDIDKFDRRSIYLYAKLDGEIVGTVRLTRLNENFWLGSRLAVKKEYRDGTGNCLVKYAERYIQENGGEILRAFVQKRAEKLFNRLGWISIRNVNYHNKPHVLMEVRCVQFRFYLP
jgi:putative N-acetyltransferase (TIGR04045 family)